MKVARIRATAVVALAMSGALAQAQADSRTGDTARQRAEDLAQAASERFDEFQRPQRTAQAQTGKAMGKDPASDAGSSPSNWIEHSNREYQRLMQRLSQASEPAKPAQKPATAPVEKATAPAEKKASPVTAVAEKTPEKSGQSGKGTDWLTESSEKFQMLMRKLAERAAPPDAKAEAEKRRTAQQVQAVVKKEEPKEPLPGPKATTVTPSAEKSAEKRPKRHPRPRRNAGSPKPAAPMRPSAPKRSASPRRP